MLALGCFVLYTMAWGWQLIASLAYQLFPALSLTQQQFSLIFTAPLLAAIFTSIPGGALGDRYGIRIVVGIAAFVAATSDLLRAFAPSFTGLFALMLVRGVAFGLIMPNLPKLVSVWIPRERSGLASGIYNCSLNIGSATGLFTGPLFPNWQTAFIFHGIAFFAAATLWMVFARTSPAGMTVKRPSIVAGLKIGAKSRNIWLIAVGQFLFQGVLISFQGNLPKALTAVHQFSPQIAGAIAGLLMLGLVTGNLFAPLISDRFGLRRPFIMFAALAGAVVLYTSWLAASGPAIWILVFVGGILMGTPPAIFYTVPAELPEIGHAYVGGASGIFVSAQNLGGLFLSVFITSPIIAAGTGAAYSSGFLVAMILLACIAVPAFFLTETGRRAAVNATRAAVTVQK